MSYGNVPERFVPNGSADSFDDREFGWDDEIEKDGPDYITLPEGDYDFEVVDFERARHEGSEKLPPCNKAIVHIRVKGKDASGHEVETIIRHQLFLHTKVEGMLCAFFTGIGQRKKGEKLKMNWAMVPGSRGRCRVGTREYNGKTYNEIKKFYEPVSSQPAPQPQQAQMSFEQGKF